MPTATPHLPLDELARLGTELFDRRVRPALRPEDDGKFVAIDVRSEEYEIDPDDHAAIRRLRARVPEGNFWLVRAGHPAAFQIRGVS